jgi:hypothetical protein
MKICRSGMSPLAAIKMPDGHLFGFPEGDHTANNFLGGPGVSLFLDAHTLIDRFLFIKPVAAVVCGRNVDGIVLPGKVINSV